MSDELYSVVCVFHVFVAFVVGDFGVFSDDYLPESVVDRDAEKEEVADYLRKLAGGVVYGSLYVYGPPGVGKTTVCRHVLRQFEGAHPEVPVVYVECAGKSRYQVLCVFHGAICGQLRRRETCRELVLRVSGRLRSRGVPLVLALDNFDQAKEVEKLLWDVLEVSRRSLTPVGLILVSTSGKALQSLVGDRLYSRLAPKPVEFSPYDEETLKQILAERLDEAYGRRVMADEALQALAEFAAGHGGNVRLLFELFLRAADEAAEQDSKLITADTAKSVIEAKRREMLALKIQKLAERNPHLIATLNAISELSKNNKAVYTGMVEKLLKQWGINVTRRSLEYYLHYLKHQGLLKLEKTRLGRGFTTRISIACHQES